MRGGARGEEDRVRVSHRSIANTEQVFQGFRRFARGSTSEFRAGNAAGGGEDGMESSESWEDALRWRN